LETSALNTRAAVNVPAASARPTSFDVFLAHNSSDKPSVQRIAERLKAARIEPWLDAWQLSGGDRWQAQLADGMLASAACAVFVGRDGVGGWTREELDLAQDRAAKEGGFRLFPVLLPGLEEPFDATAVLPPFLRSRMWVDLRKGVEDTRGFQALVNAIKGVAPGPPQPVAVDADVVPYRGLQTFDVEHVDFFFGASTIRSNCWSSSRATAFWQSSGRRAAVSRPSCGLGSCRASRRAA